MQREYRGSKIIKDCEEEIKVDYYLIADSKIFSDESSPRRTYGVEIVENDKECELVQDVSLDEDATLEIIDTLRRNEVLPIHLHDIIEDLL